MRIVILHTDFRIYWPARLKSFHKFLQTMGHELIVVEIAGKGSPYEFASHEDIREFPSWKILFPESRIEDIGGFMARKAIYNILSGLKPDIVLSGAIAYYSGASALKWSVLKNKPLVIFDNARLDDVRRSNLVNLVKTELYKLGDSVFCPAPSHLPSFEYWGFRRESVFYGLNCVDNDYFEITQVPCNLLLPESYFLTIGRQINKKNLKFLIAAYKLYLKEIKTTSIPLVIIGDGPLHNQLLLDAGELVGRYIFFYPFQTQEHLPDIYKRSIAYILPSLYGETWGLTVNEAMSSSKPVIVSNQCGCVETLVSDINGWSFDPADEYQLRDILIEVSNLSTDELDKLGENSKKIIDNWGLSQFNNGLWSSVEYALQKKSNKRKLFIPSIISLFWNGRFRTEMPDNKQTIRSIKKIVFLHTDFRIYWKSRLNNLNRILQHLKIEFCIIEIAGKGSPYEFAHNESEHKNISWHILFPENDINEISAKEISYKISEILDKINPDIVFAGALAFPSGAGALKWKHKTAKPIVIFDDARQQDVVRPWYINKLKQLFYKNVDAVMCPAPSHATGFKEWGLKEENIFYGIDVVDNDFFRAPILIEPDKTNSYLLAVGRQVEKKNWIKLIEAFIDYKYKSPASNLSLIFIGDGPLHSVLTKTAQGRDDIKFIEFIQQTELIKYYHSAKGLVLPSVYGETWGLVVNEAMASGLPVLVSQECGCAETLVQNGENGWLFNPHDTNDISTTIGLLDKVNGVELMNMKQKSQDIIAEWGLSYFNQNIFNILDHLSSKKIKNNYISGILSKFWNGRYRPS